MGIQQSFYGVDGETKNYLQSKYIATKQHCLVLMQRIDDSSWDTLSALDWDLQNNTVKLAEAISGLTYNQIEIRVADEQNELTSNPSDISIVASMTSEVVAIAGISAEVVTVAGDSAYIQTVAGDTLAINIVAGDTVALNVVASDTVALNLVGADLAKGIGTNQPTDSAILNALTNANQTKADVILTNADVVITNGDAVLTNADVLLTHADVVLTNADAVSSASSALSANASAMAAQQSADKAEAFSPTNNLVSISCSRLLAGETFIDAGEYKATDLQLMYADGYDGHAKNTSETISGTTTINPLNLADGMNYVYKEEGGLYYATLNEPRYSVYDKTHADDNSFVYDDGKWHEASTDGELQPNDFSTNTDGWIGSNATLSVSGGQLSVINGGSYGQGYIEIAVEAGKEYIVQAILTDTGNSSASGGLHVFSSTPDGTGNGDIVYKSLGNGVIGLLEATFTPSATTVYVAVGQGGSYTAKYSSVSVFKKQAELGTPLTTPITFMKDILEVSGGAIVGKHEFVYPDTVLGNVKITDGLDLGQKWVDVTSERVQGITYKNETGKPIMVSVIGNATNGSPIAMFVGTGLRVGLTYMNTSGTSKLGMNFIVPPNETYYADNVGGSFLNWSELR